MGETGKFKEGKKGKGREKKPKSPANEGCEGLDEGNSLFPEEAKDEIKEEKPNGVEKILGMPSKCAEGNGEG